MSAGQPCCQWVGTNPGCCQLRHEHLPVGSPAPRRRGRRTCGSEAVPRWARGSSSPRPVLCSRIHTRAQILHRRPRPQRQSPEQGRAPGDWLFVSGQPPAGPVPWARSVGLSFPIGTMDNGQGLWPLWPSPALYDARTLKSKGRGYKVGREGAPPPEVASAKNKTARPRGLISHRGWG